MVREVLRPLRVDPDRVERVERVLLPLRVVGVFDDPVRVEAPVVVARLGAGEVVAFLAVAAFFAVATAAPVFAVEDAGAIPQTLQ